MKENSTILDWVFPENLVKMNKKGPKINFWPYELFFLLLILKTPDLNFPKASIFQHFAPLLPG